MRHWPFLQALTNCENDQMPEWGVLTAGLLLLRHFDDWRGTGAVQRTDDRELFVKIRRQIDAIPDAEQETRNLLGTVLDVFQRIDPADVIVAVGPLLAYASYLEQDGHAALARHVLAIITEALDEPCGTEDVPSVVGAYFHRGRLTQRLGDYDGADALYQRALVLAEQAGEPSLLLHVRLAIGALHMARGNLADAETLLDTVVEASRAQCLRAVEARALRVRGGVRQHRGRPGDALQDLYRAYAISPNRPIRELLLGDIAACAEDLGMRQVAKTIHQRLARTGRSTLSRGLALINLLEIAVAQGEYATFRALWKELRASYLTVLPSGLVLCAEFYAAKGVERFRGPKPAAAAYHAVADRASSVGAHQIAFMARDRLQALTGS